MKGLSNGKRLWPKAEVAGRAYQPGYLSPNFQNPSMVIIKSGDIAGGYLA